VLGLLRDLARPGLSNEALFRAGVTALKAISTTPSALAPTWCSCSRRGARGLGPPAAAPICVVCGDALRREVVFAPALGGAAHRRCAEEGPRPSLPDGVRAAFARVHTDRWASFVADPLPPVAQRAVRALHDLFLPSAFEGSVTVGRALRRG
jgi:hypothetical protein